MKDIFQGDASDPLNLENALEEIRLAWQWYLVARKLHAAKLLPLLGEPQAVT